MFRNYQLEDLLKQLLDAKKAESEKYYDKIANNGVGEDNKGEFEDKSPIETVSILICPEHCLIHHLSSILHRIYSL